jgi:MFS transporter, Spinster family, sphingosine-1-phosphate transporter
MNGLAGAPAAPGTDGYLAGAGTAWFAYLMTVALMLFDYADRQVIVSLFPFLKAAWQLSDKELGALVSVVSIGVALAGIPVALLADRTSRVRSIAAMATLWSLATASCMWARSYGQLFVARALVGLGEAGYGSVGGALIASHFPARLRGTMLAGFFASASVGSVLGVALGGTIASRWGWQAAFGVVGIPGLAIALLYLTVRDYPTERLPSGSTRAVTFGSTVAIACASLARLRTLRWVCLGAAAQLIVVSSVWAWLPSFLNRYAGLSPARAGIHAALIVLIGAAGSLVWGALVDRVGASPGRSKLLILAALCVPTAVVLPIAFTAGSAGWASESGAFALIAVGGFVMTCTVGPVAALVLEVVHPSLRATGASVLSLFQNLLGLAAGPLIAGALSDRWGLGAALSIVPVFSLLAAGAFVVASRSYAGERPQVSADTGARHANPGAPQLADARR